MKLFAGLGALDRSSLAHNVWAGVSLAALNIPQVLGYTSIAGTPVITGLYTVLLPSLAFTVFGSSLHLMVAADSATAAIMSGALSDMAKPASAAYMQLVGMLAMLVAGALVLARVFRLGFFADFMSRTVLVGFLTGVGVQVSIAMLDTMAGVPTAATSTLGRLWEVSTRQPDLPTAALAGGVVACILLGRWLVPRFPLAMLLVVGAIVASAHFGFKALGIAVIGPIQGGLPGLSWPMASWHQTLALLPVAGSCVVMILAQSAATARAFAEKYHEDLDEDADILGLAVANAAAAVSGAFVVNGSPTQTAIADHAGARGQVAQQTLVAIVLVVLLFLTGPLQYLPRCVLAAVVFTIGIGMIDLAGLRAIRRESPGEFTLALITAAAVVGVGVEQGILLAIALSLFRHVRHSYRPHTMILEPDAAGRWVPVPVKPGEQTETGLIVYRFGADLFYANNARFCRDIRSLLDHAPQPVRWLVVDASAITDIDYSAAQSVRDLLDELQKRSVRVVFARVSMGLRADMDRHRIIEILGADKVFTSLHEALNLVHGGTPTSSDTSV